MKNNFSLLTDVESNPQGYELASEPVHTQNPILRGVALRTQWRIFTAALLLSDFLVIGLAFQSAYWIRFEMHLPLFNLGVVPSFYFYQRLMLIIVPLWIGIFAVKGLYDRNRLLGGTQEYANLFNSTLIGMVLVIAAGFLGDDFNYSRGWILLAWFVTTLFVFVSRFLMRRIVYFLRIRGFLLSPALIVGANDEGIMLAGQLFQWRTSGFKVLGFIDKKLRPGTPVWKNLIVLGDMDQLGEVVDRFDVQEIILASSAISSRDKMVEIFKQYGTSENVKVRFSSGLYEIITTGLTVSQIAYVPLVEVNSVRLTGLDSVIKIILDYSLTVPGLLLLSPLLLVIAIVVKLDSPGPIIHRRRVVGVNGRTFDAFKFRTMYINGDEILAEFPDLERELKENHKLKYDPRITKAGKFLRKFSLDELPQLFNVIVGDMSLVGPRMITEAELDKYEQWDMNLLTVRPGITGLWQVSGRSDISYEERVRMDMFYIRNWTIWLDIQLLIQTIPAVIKGHGAY